MEAALDFAEAAVQPRLFSQSHQESHRVGIPCRGQMCAFQTAGTTGAVAEELQAAPFPERAGGVKTHLGTEVVTRFWLVVPALSAVTQIGFLMQFSCAHGDFSVVKSACFLVLSLRANGLYLELASVLRRLLRPDTQRRVGPGLAVGPGAACDRVYASSVLNW